MIEDPDDTFASTPSLATLKLLLTLACTYNWFILAGDVSTAFLHALLNDDVFVIPPGEFYPHGGVLWKLRRAMYGLKQSPKAWQLHFASVMADLGFKRLKSDANLYFHPEYKVYLLCYVDDVLLFGAQAPCEHLFAKLQAPSSEEGRDASAGGEYQLLRKMHHTTRRLHRGFYAYFVCRQDP